MHVFEVPFYLTKTEAGYCLLIAGVTAEAGRGTDIGAKAEALIRRLEAEMKKPTIHVEFPVHDDVKNFMVKFNQYLANKDMKNHNIVNGKHICPKILNGILE